MSSPFQQKITKNLQYLDSFQLLEVSDFIEFIYHKRRICASRDFEAIDKLYGKYRSRLSSSQEFARQKQTEINLEEKKWEKK